MNTSLWSTLDNCWRLLNKSEYQQVLNIILNVLVKNTNVEEIRSDQWDDIKKLLKRIFDYCDENTKIEWLRVIEKWPSAVNCNGHDSLFGEYKHRISKWSFLQYALKHYIERITDEKDVEEILATVLTKINL